ncbi:NHLP leader peptide family RiPP precursor [uncultured Aquimarina sp.]|uniref:NHLP leader peptide family RiPP precursor n=1 Tax=uncultured Aquimarina sp. TaxID=575652 RepID=UPI0026031251|nr:NHLP leader peptide family RiPP precursor [uncultured Aquimarina sp.]
MEQTKNQRLLQEVVVKAWEDTAFKKEFVSNPLEAVKKLTGETLELPKGKELVVIDSSDENKVYVNIPTKSVPLEDVELSDEELEKVAGGTMTDDTIIDSCFGPCGDDFPWLTY